MAAGCNGRISSDGDLRRAGGRSDFRLSKAATSHVAYLGRGGRHRVLNYLLDDRTGIYNADV